MPKQSVFDPCAYCLAKRLVKIGSLHGENQCYWCRACGKTFTPFGRRQKQRDEQAIQLFRQGALPHEVQRETGIGTQHLKTLQAQHAPHLPLQRSKPTNPADYLEQIQLLKLTKKEGAEAAQWITPRSGQFLGSDKLAYVKLRCPPLKSSTRINARRFDYHFENQSF